MERRHTQAAGTTCASRVRTEDDGPEGDVVQERVPLKERSCLWVQNAYYTKISGKIPGKVL